MSTQVERNLAVERGAAEEDVFLLISFRRYSCPGRFLVAH